MKKSLPVDFLRAAGGSCHSRLRLRRGTGSAVWERRDGTGVNVTFPARPFIVHGERRNVALLRAVDDPSAQNRIRQMVLEAFEMQSPTQQAGASS